MASLKQSENLESAFPCTEKAAGRFHRDVPENRIFYTEHYTKIGAGPQGFPFIFIYNVREKNSPICV